MTAPDPAGTAEVPAADAALLAELRGIVGRADAPPEDVAAMSRSLLSWRDPDAWVAELVADSRELAGAVRGGDDVVLHFRAGGIEIVVQLSASVAGEMRLVGQVEPGRAGTVHIRRFASQLEVGADELGRFSAEGVGPGPLSLRWAPADGDQPAVQTAWQLV